MISIPRKLENYLLSWAKSSDRKVLLLRGARQVGKTYLVRKHAKGTYRNILEINFASERRVHEFFKGDYDINLMLERISAFYGVAVKDGETLLFLDEIQECPEAISSLRFFYEKRPNLHVIASGSLLEFALSEIPSFGVGRISSLFLRPVTFDEYLAASGAENLIEHLKQAGPNGTQVRAIHEKFLSFFREYLYTGGLPEVVRDFLENKDYLRVNNIIDNLRLSFEDDFLKYRKRVPVDRLKEVLRSSALQAGKKFVFSRAYPDAGAKQVDTALNLLNYAGIVNKAYHVAANGVPLGGEVEFKKFKTFPFDHGVYQRLIGVTPSEVVVDSFDPVNKGAYAEVYAGNALIAHAPPWQNESLYYWHRESKSSNAEVDYVISIGQEVVPIEIKSASKGKMQSMFKFLQEKNRRLGIRISMENFAIYENILVIPLYAISQIERLVSEFGGR